MGLLRTGALLAVGIALLPSEPEKQAELYNRAAAAATWTMTFCDRNAETCEKGGLLWTQFVAKAEFGARLALDALRETPPGEEGAIKPASLNTPKPHTLTDHDMKPGWRGKSEPKGSV